MSHSAVAEAEAEVEAETRAAAAAAPVPAESAPAGATAPVKASVVPVTRALDGVARRRRRSDQRWEVTEADLNMYTLITGRAPSESERVAALTGISEEERKLREAGAGHGGTIGAMASRIMSRSRPGLVDDDDAIAPAPGRTWSSAVLFAYLRDGVCCFSANLAQLRVTRPQVSAWVRHVSTEARRRLQETQARLAASATRTK